jgi:hypothetical protein
MKPDPPAPRFRLRMLAVGLLAPTALLGLVLSAPTHGAQRNKKPPTAREKFKNIQVLKNLPADQLLPLMHTVSASLGVHCDFCHVVNADHTGFDLDTKPTKRTARKMIIMVQDINAHQPILNKQATCYMCHHGHPEPQTQVPPETPK